MLSVLFLWNCFLYWSIAEDGKSKRRRIAFRGFHVFSGSIVSDSVGAYEQIEELVGLFHAELDKFYMRISR